MSDPITKKLGEILAENPELRVNGIRRFDADFERIDNVAARLRQLHLEMTWHVEWNAWSSRPTTGIYQQIIIFVPRVDE